MEVAGTSSRGGGGGGTFGSWVGAVVDGGIAPSVSSPVVLVGVPVVDGIFDTMTEMGAVEIGVVTWTNVAAEAMVGDVGRSETRSSCVVTVCSGHIAGYTLAFVADMGAIASMGSMVKFVSW